MLQIEAASTPKPIRTVMKYASPDQVTSLVVSLQDASGRRILMRVILSIGGEHRRDEARGSSEKNSLPIP